MLRRPLTGEPLAVDLLNTRWRSAGGDVDLLATVQGFDQWLTESGQDDLTATETARAAACDARAAILDLVELRGADGSGARGARTGVGSSGTGVGSSGTGDAGPRTGDPVDADADSAARDTVETAAESALNAILARGLTVQAISGGAIRKRTVVTDPEWTAAWRAAASYLTLRGQSPDGIRQCQHPDCVLHFFDRTGRRRWCSMAGCGNRTKAKRHYARSTALRPRDTQAGG